MSKLEIKGQLLTFLDGVNGSITSIDIASKLDVTHDQAVGVIKSIEIQGLVRTETSQIVAWLATEEGQDILTNGSPEYSLVLAMRANDNKMSVADMKANFGKPMGQALKLKWISKDGDDMILSTSAPASDVAQEELKALIAGQLPEAKGKDIARRKWVSKSTTTVFTVEKTDSFTTEIKEVVADLDKTMLLTGDWKNKEFKDYNWSAAGVPPQCGSIHPLIDTFNEFRNVLVQMGFSEMNTDRWVESSFWNFDALFQPQTHPVRDAHDTFFTAEPALACFEDALKEKSEIDGIDLKLLSEDYFQRVKATHEAGDGESLGWMCNWDPVESKKLILRTHTTAVSSRILRKLALEYQQDPENCNLERKFFSIDRVFRNETLDATHLAEFHQVEGVVVSRTASLAKLMEVIKTFFIKIGIPEVEFKPAYNPYTEPSMEIFGYHPQLGKWTEIGNSGVFRPEMLKPMGLPDDVVVLGWGLSLERPTMITTQVKDIRELLGPRSKLSVI